MKKEKKKHTKEKGGKTMAVLAKPSNRLVSVDAKSSPDFIKRFNKNTITPKMLESCTKATRLFKHGQK